jgi:hypothetical protein
MYCKHNLPGGSSRLIPLPSAASPHPFLPLSPSLPFPLSLPFSPSPPPFVSLSPSLPLPLPLLSSPFPFPPSSTPPPPPCIPALSLSFTQLFPHLTSHLSDHPPTTTTSIQSDDDTWKPGDPIPPRLVCVWVVCVCVCVSLSLCVCLCVSVCVCVYMSRARARAHTHTFLPGRFEHGAAGTGVALHGDAHG